MNSETDEWILASRQGEGYIPDETIASFEDIQFDFEYADIATHQFQIWKFPSGEIFDIEPDRVLSPAENQFITPYQKGELQWKPVLRLAGRDPLLVANAHSKLHGSGRH